MVVERITMAHILRQMYSDEIRNLDCFTQAELIGAITQSSSTEKSTNFKKEETPRQLNNSITRRALSQMEPLGSGQRRYWSGKNMESYR